jgi:hypothetical protein
MKVPAISGAEKDVFDTAFWKGITRRDGDRPLEGSIGVYWHLYKDLRDVIDFEKEYVNPLSPRKPLLGAPIKTAVLTLLRAFFNFAQQTAQPYFFIKKGTRPLWLVRKTGTYWYEDREGWNPHRISFEFVRDVTEEEGRAHTGIGIKTLFQMELNEPKLGAAPLEEEEMPPKKVATTKATTTTTATVATATTVTTVTAKPKKTTKAESTAATVAPGPVPGAIKAYAASHVETNDVPLLVEEVEIVRIVPLEYKGVSYIRDPIKNKVYKRTGAYVGRWSPKDETIHTEIPNSDDE